MWLHTVIPYAAPHRISVAESMVKVTKRSLHYLPTSSLSILEFDAVLKNIASTIYNRPLGFNTSEDQVLTPNQLLLGRNYDVTLPPESMREVKITVPIRCMKLCHRSCSVIKFRHTTLNSRNFIFSNPWFSWSIRSFSILLYKKSSCKVIVLLWVNVVLEN